MSITRLVEFEDDSGDFVSAWHDPEEDAVVVQYNYVHITMSVERFKNFADAIGRAETALREGIEVD